MNYENRKSEEKEVRFYETIYKTHDKRKIKDYCENNKEFLKDHQIEPTISSNLILEKEISLKEALCGFIFDIELVNKKKICVNNTIKNNIIRPGSKKVIKDMGMVRNGNVGSLIIEFDVKLPNILGTPGCTFV